jgi:hypothetical protein
MSDDEQVVISVVRSGSALVDRILAFDVDAL